MCRIVAEMAARHLKPVLLELGGKAPLIILDDADVPEAVRAAAFGAFVNQGQVSGYGRFGGRAGIAEFTELRWLTINSAPAHYPF